MVWDAHPASAPGTPCARGRVIAEAWKDGTPPKTHQHREISTTLDLPDRRIITTIELEQMDGEMYPSGSSTRWLAALEQVRAGEGPVADRQGALSAALKVADGGG